MTAIKLAALGSSTAVAAPAGLAGLPASFSQFSFSTWTCMPDDFGAGLSLSAGNGTDSSYVQVFFSRLALLLTIDIWSGPESNPANRIWGAAYTVVPAAVGMAQNFLVSVDTATQTAKVYSNDTALSLAGVYPWLSSATIDNPGNYPLVQWNVHTGAADPGLSGAGDWWFDGSETAFIDFDVEANRRKFINADLTPVNLGANGENPTGSSPPIFLHIANGYAADFATNYGTGPTWSVAGTPLLIDGACSTGASSSGPLQACIIGKRTAA